MTAEWLSFESLAQSWAPASALRSLGLLPILSQMVPGQPAHLFLCLQPLLLPCPTRPCHDWLENLEWLLNAQDKDQNPHQEVVGMLALPKGISPGWMSRVAFYPHRIIQDQRCSHPQVRYKETEFQRGCVPGPGLAE